MKGSWKVGVRTTLALFLGAFAAAAATGQAIPAVQKTSDLSGFLAYSTVKTDYDPQYQPGFVAGFVYTRYFRHSYLDPSLELRASYTPVESLVGQHVFSGGLRVEHEYLRILHPYADLLIGAGTVDFDFPAGRSDNSVVYTYGGGVDVDLKKHFSAKVEVERSHWHLGNDDTRQPYMFDVGFVYHFPFRKRYTN